MKNFVKNSYSSKKSVRMMEFLPQHSLLPDHREGLLGSSNKCPVRDSYAGGNQLSQFAWN